MKIIVDENISFGKEAFSNFGDVELVHGRRINKQFLSNAHALIVRSITKVDKSILESTPVKFVGTATIGTDHVDKNYLKQNNIHFADAAGCNSHAVKEYVFSAIFEICVKHNITIKNKSIGIIGIGNIGSKVAAVAESLGLHVVKNDPPLQRKNNSKEFRSLEEVLKCDIITCHVPLNKGGIDNTVHLLNEEKINKLKPGTILINSSRGQVVDNNALKNRLQNKNDIHVVLDVWEAEPEIDLELLAEIEIGTPHIAGYSLEGKVNGTTFVYNALAEFEQVDPFWKPILPEVEKNIISVDKNISKEETFHEIFEYVYSIREDDFLMRKIFSNKEKEVGSYFDSLRKNYRLRRELNNYKFNFAETPQDLINTLQLLRLQNLQVT